MSTRMICWLWGLSLAAMVATTSLADEFGEMQKYCDRCKRWMPGGENCDCFVRSTPPSHPQPPIPLSTQSVQETEQRIRDLQAQLNRLERERLALEQKAQLDRANATLRDISRIAGQADEMEKRLYDYYASNSAASRLSGEHKELQGILVAELQEFRRQKETYERVLPRARELAVTFRQHADRRQAIAMARAQKLFEAGRLRGPAEGLPPLVVARPGTKAAEYLLAGKGLEPVADRWFPGATRSDQQRQKHSENKANTGHGLKAAPPSPRLRVIEVTSVTEEQLRSLRQDLVTESQRISHIRARLSAEVAQSAALWEENKRLGAANAESREEIKACRRAIHELETQLKEACRDYVISAAQARALETLETMLDKAEATRGWWRRSLEDIQEAAAQYTCYVGALQRMKDYGDLMHRRFDPGGPMERFFALFKEAQAQHFHGATADRLASFADDDMRKFGHQTIGLTAPDAAIISSIFSLTKKEEEP